MRWLRQSKPRKTADLHSLQSRARFRFHQRHLATARLLTGWLHVNPVISNLPAILPCSLANFFLCDLFVFTTGGNP